MQIFNFAAGPSMMPRVVLERAREEFLDWHGTGLSVLEMPFTGPDFQTILDEATADLCDLLAIPDSHRILFLQGGGLWAFRHDPHESPAWPAGSGLRGDRSLVEKSH